MTRTYRSTFTAALVCGAASLLVACGGSDDPASITEQAAKAVDGKANDTAEAADAPFVFRLTEVENFMGRGTQCRLKGTITNGTDFELTRMGVTLDNDYDQDPSRIGKTKYKAYSNLTYEATAENGLPAIAPGATVPVVGEAIYPCRITAEDTDGLKVGILTSFGCASADPQAYNKGLRCKAPQLRIENDTSYPLTR